MDSLVYNSFYLWFLFRKHNMRRKSHLREDKDRVLLSRGIHIHKDTKLWAMKKYRMTSQQVMWLLNYSSKENKENLTRIKEILEYDKKIKLELKSLKENIDEIISEVYLQTNETRLLRQVQ